MPRVSALPYLAALAVFSSLTLAPLVGLAAPLRDGPGPESLPIYGGTLVPTCGWPSVVQMDDSCTGTLVHPQVVVYAGHCGASYGKVRFGEVGTEAARAVEVAQCWADGMGTGIGHDYAVCELAEPVEDVPIVPILMGCEADALAEGVTVSLIGFGEADSEPFYGVKRETTATIESFNAGEVFIYDAGGKDTCYGDSGGPVMIQLADGTWRVFGITSYGVGDCGTGTWYSMIHTDAAWFETKTGLDLTPCHTSGGVWQPTPACGGFPTDPGTPAGTWADGCQGGPVGGMSATCGPPHDEEPDVTPPEVELTSPPPNHVFMVEEQAHIEIVASARDLADKPEGWGISVVRLVVNGKTIGNSDRLVPPYAWNVDVPSGQFLLQALAVDVAGNEALSAPVAIGVNAEPPALPEPPEETSTGEADSTGEAPTTSGEAPTTSGGSSSGGETGELDTSTSDSDGGPAAADDDGGCGCTHGPSSPAVLLMLLPLLGLRRRRR